MVSGLLHAHLTPAEKFDLLSLALSDGDRDRMSVDWMLRELIEIGDPRAVATCRQVRPLAGGADRTAAGG